MINLNTPEVKAIREQFKQQVQERQLALKNAPRLEKPKKEKT